MRNLCQARNFEMVQDFIAAAHIMWEYYRIEMYAINCSTQIVTDESTNISGTTFPPRYSNMFMAHVNAKCLSIRVR